MSVLDLYYGLWSQMLSWPILKRASLILGIASLIIYILCMPFIMKILSFFLYLINGLLKCIYCGIIEVIEYFMKNRTQMERAAVLNSFSAKAGKISETINDCREKIKKKKRISFLKMAALYILFVLLIGLPDFFGNSISTGYLEAVSSARTLYQKIESGTLEKAAEYPPLFREKAKYVDVAQTEDSIQEIWLSLSQDGKNGANMRAKASANGEKIKVLSGDDKALYLGKEGTWVHVRLETGEEGFIKASLLQDVPDGQ